MRRQPVMVFGSYVVDVMSRSPRLPVPGETVKGSAFRLGSGGKGFNQAAAACRAGGEVVFATKLGEDGFGREALQAMEAMGIDTRHVLVDPRGKTGIALIMVDDHTGQNQIVVCIGACGTITAQEVERLRAEIRACPLLLVQMETNPDAMERVVALSHQNGGRVLLNPAPAHPIPDSLYSRVDMITPNETEAAALAGVAVDSDEGLRAAAAFFHSKGVREVVITLGGQGVYLDTPALRRRLPPFRVDAVDTTGAGDAFNGALAAALAEGMELADAAQFAQAAAALCVTRLGTSDAMPARREIEALLRQQDSTWVRRMEGLL